MNLEEKSEVEDVTKSDILDLATWNQERSTEQLLSFISRRESALAASDDLSEDML